MLYFKSNIYVWYDLLSYHAMDIQKEYLLPAVCM